MTDTPDDEQRPRCTFQNNPKDEFFVKHCEFDANHSGPHSFEQHDTPAEKPRDLVTVPASELRKLQDEVERLKEANEEFHGLYDTAKELRTENLRLRAALELIAKGSWLGESLDAQQIARAALEGKE